MNNNFFSENKEILDNTTVKFENCSTSRCALKRNSTMQIEIKFKLGLYRENKFNKFVIVEW